MSDQDKPQKVSLENQLIHAGLPPSMLDTRQRSGRLRIVFLVAASIWAVVVTVFLAFLWVREPAPAPVSSPVAQQATPSPEARATASKLPVVSLTPSLAESPTPDTPELINLSVYPEEGISLPADGKAKKQIQVNVELSRPEFGWTMRFSADKGSFDQNEVSLNFDESGQAEAAVTYIVPTTPLEAAAIIVSLHDAKGTQIEKREIPLEIFFEQLQVIWDESGSSYYPKNEPIEFSFHLKRSDGSIPQGNYTIQMEAAGGVVQPDTLEMSGGEQQTVAFTPANDVNSATLTLTAEGVELKGGQKTLTLMPTVTSFIIDQVSEWVGVAVCGARDEVAGITLGGQAQAIKEGIEPQPLPDQPLSISYKIILPANGIPEMFRKADGTLWPPDEPLLINSDESGRFNVQIFDGDYANDPSDPPDTLVLYAQSSGLAQFTIHDEVGDLSEQLGIVPVGLRRVELSHPEATEAVTLDAGVDYKFTRSKWVPNEDTNNNDRFLYTLANPADDSLRVLAVFWAFNDYLNQPAGAMVNLRPPNSKEETIENIIPVTSSPKWFQSLLEVAENNVNPKSDTDIALSSEGFEVQYFGETALIGDFILHRVYAAGTATQAALVSWPDACPIKSE